jgi:chitinase
MWVTAYYPAYRQSYLQASNVDFTALSHVIHFSVVPNPDGSLDTNINALAPSYSADLVSRVHAAGKKVLICVGGAESQAGFQGATTRANRGLLITNLVNFVSRHGYDGVDVDWEPLSAADASAYTNFVIGLRALLDTFPEHKLLTAAVAWSPSLFASIQNQFDQINLMTYDLAGLWQGWITWFNSPIFDGNYRFPSTGGLVPSIDGMVSNFIKNGLAPEKVGIGTAFFGNIWSGGSGTSTGGAARPRQSWATVPSVSQIPYSEIMSNYFQTNLYHWDTAAEAAYLSIDNPGSANDKFISYDDEHTCLAKVNYARNRHLGGVMIWELAQAYSPSRPVGHRDPLLQAVKTAVAAATNTNGDTNPPSQEVPQRLSPNLRATNSAPEPSTIVTNPPPGTNVLLHTRDAVLSLITTLR